MGYSISIVCQTAEIQKQMLKFLDKEFKPWPEIAPYKCSQYTSFPTTDLDYFHNELAIGLNYGAIAGAERCYAYSLIRWLAKIIGEKDYYYYDEEKQYLRNDEKWDGELDELGVPKKIMKEKDLFGELGVEPEESLNIIKKEITKLNDLWNQKE